MSDLQNPPVPTPPATPPTPPEGGKTFDQTEVSAIATREHDRGSREGRRAALEEVEQKLGGVSLDDVLAAYNAVQSAQDSQKSETQKALEAAQKAQQEAEADRARAKAEVFAARRNRALTAAGVPADAQDAIVVPGVTIDSTDEDIAAAVTALKERIPALFTPATPPTPPPPGTGGRPPAGRPPAGTFGQGGKQEFERRFGQPA